MRTYFMEGQLRLVLHTISGSKPTMMAHAWNSSSQKAKTLFVELEY